MRGVAQFDVTDQNVNVTVPLERGVDLEGRVIVEDGARKPPMDGFHVGIFPVKGSIIQDELVLPAIEPEGKFRLVNVGLGQYLLGNSGLATGYYVKEVRFNGRPVSPGVVPGRGYLSVTGPGSLEIIVGDKPAAISGQVTDGDRPVNNAKVLLVRWPVFAEQPFQSVIEANGDLDGRFQLTEVAPGEYRILAVSLAGREKLNEPNILERVLSRADKTTLGPSSTQNLPLRLTDPSR